MSTTPQDSVVRGHNPAAGAADLALVTQVVLAERQGRDRGWWDLMGAAFWPDSTVSLSWYDGNGAGFVAGSAAMAARGAVALHRICAPAVQVRGDRAYAELSVAMRIAVEINGVAGDLICYTRLNYRLERREGEWRIVQMVSIYENVTLNPAVPGQTITIDPVELAGYRSSYAILAWNIAREGRTPSDSELGDDRPEEVAAYYDATWAWLNAA